MEVINTFSQGQNSDQSKTILNKETYLQALNFRGLNELGSSNGSLVNIKGNECKLTFPTIQNVYKLQIVDGSGTTDNSMQLTINGTTKTTLITNGTTGADLYNWIIAQFPNCFQYTGATVVTKTFDVAYEDDYIVLYQQPKYQDCTSVASVPTVVTVLYDEDDGTRAVLNFINSDGTSTLAQDTDVPYVLGVASADVIPIGSTFILDDIYILTAPDGTALTDANMPDNDELQDPGTIWRLNIDDITKQHTLTLVYHGRLDFTKFHPIPPSAITGRYESAEIKRIYWSDNYNKIRTLNTAIPQLMALNPSQLNVIPQVEYVQPILNSIGTASPGLPAGCYQMAYRLSRALGSVTNYSELSLPVYLTANAESTSFWDYEGGLGNSGKSITWKVDNLDTSYDQIEFIVTYRASATAIPTIKGPGPQPLNNTMTFTYADPDASSNNDITLEEFLLFNGTFTHAKTVDTKDNRLFWGNVRAPRKELESYDARAFRANDAGQIKLTNGGINTAYTFAQAKALAQTEDTINEYYLTSNGDYSPNACYLKPTDLSKLGGEGENISYEFGTISFQSDQRKIISGTEGWDLHIDFVPPAFRDTTTDGNIISSSGLIYDYPQNNKYTALKQPEKTSLFKGFQHEEIYRFGIQFFDKQGNPYFTKWIGDIKFPSYGDSNPSGPTGDFRLSYEGPSNDLYVQVLYIKFNVDVSKIQDLIGGYQIVRTKRTSSDKTIWGVGMINPMVPASGNDLSATAMLPAGFHSQNEIFNGVPRRAYKPFPSQESVETLNYDNDDGGTNFSRFKTFDCWDIDLGDRPIYAAGDRLRIRSRLQSVSYRIGSGGYRQWFDKSYGTTAGQQIPTNTQNIDNGTSAPFNSATGSNNDNTHQPYFILKMVDETLYQNYTDFITSGSNQLDYIINYTEYLGDNVVTSYGGYTINNKGIDTPSGVSATNDPARGKQTLFMDVAGNVAGTGPGTLGTSDFGCIANTVSLFYKLLALYYKPNNNQYGGNTYVQRSYNEYIPCSEYVPIIQDNTTVNIPSFNLITFGGDVFTAIYDMQKTYKPTNGAEYKVYEYDSSTGTWLGTFGTAEAKFSSTFFFPITSVTNPEVRMGAHVNRNMLSNEAYYEDTYVYENYNNAENDTKTYFPKPLNFQASDEWINRIYWSELKFNNEIQDSWSEYLTDSFYDVEGNYGGINALISLKENMYYLQDRGVGSLLINPVSLINDQVGTTIQLGNGTNGEVIQKHFYKAIDTGTVHQWSVYRSQSAITFVDARHKKIYLFNGESVTPISDIKGQRNFTIKRLHNELLKYDNPIIDKGIITTYDYYHNEFLYTFNNKTPNTTNDENLTLAYSEIIDAFTGLYSFTPNLYINSNKYLISTNRANKLWFHNYGAYGSFYGTIYPSTLKLLVNDNPLYTKVFDNMTIESEAIQDNVEWNDDLNIYPGSPTNPSYPDDVNIKDSTFNSARFYNQYQNTDWTTLTITPPGNNIRKVEQGFNLQIPRNKFDYDTYNPSTYSIFDPSKLTKTTFGERLRDKWLIADFKYNNSSGLRFIIHNIKTLLRISDR